MELTDVLDQFIRDMNPPRGDEHVPHVADLSGCDRATGARYQGLLAPFDADTLRKFKMGNDIENDVLTAIGRHRPDLILGMRVAISIGLDGVEGHIVDDDYVPRPDEIVGHPDGVLPELLLEVKSTEFMSERTPPYQRIVPVSVKELQHHFQVQAGAYALGLGIKRAVVIIQCRASGIESGISFDPRTMETEICDRIRAVLAIKRNGTLPEPTLHASTINAKTGLSWLCKHCLVPKEHCKLNVRNPQVVFGRESIEI